MPHDERDGSLSDWLGRFGISWPGRSDPGWSRTVAGRGGGRHATRALRRFVDTLRTIEHPVILDLGPAAGQTVSFLGHELECRLVVADLFASLEAAEAGDPGGSRADIIRQSLEQPAGSVDAVICWDLCDYLEQDDADALAAAVTHVLKPGGVALAMFSTVLYQSAEITRFAIETIEFLNYRPVPSALMQRRVWLSRDVTRIFSPLRVDETYLLAHGQREVLLRKTRTAT